MLSDTSLIRPVAGESSSRVVQGLPKGSNVVPFWDLYGFWVRDYNILPKKELHWRVWVYRVYGSLQNIRRLKQGAFASIFVQLVHRHFRLYVPNPRHVCKCQIIMGYTRIQAVILPPQSPFNALKSPGQGMVVLKSPKDGHVDCYGAECAWDYETSR